MFKSLKSNTLATEPLIVVGDQKYKPGVLNSEMEEFTRHIHALAFLIFTRNSSLMACKMLIMKNEPVTPQPFG